MTFAEAYSAACEIATARATAVGSTENGVSLEVTAWRFSHDSTTLTWQIYCCLGGHHYEGRTADEVVAAYRAGIRRYGLAPVTDEAIAAVTDVRLPEPEPDL